MKTTTKEKTYSVDIRKLTHNLGVEIAELPMISPVTGVLSGDNTPVMTLNSALGEPQKRMAIAGLLAVCLEEGHPVWCIMTDSPADSVAKRARELLMSEDSFRHEYTRLNKFGKLRPSILATLFNVPLSDTLLRLRDLGLDM